MAEHPEEIGALGKRELNVTRADGRQHPNNAICKLVDPYERGLPGSRGFRSLEPEQFKGRHYCTPDDPLGIGILQVTIGRADG